MLGGWGIPMISTRNLSELANIAGLMKLSQSLATLDAILCPEWEFRYFSFNNSWESNAKLGLMRNGEGDDWLLYFNDQGAVLKGFVHNCPMAVQAPWPGIFESIPKAFSGFLHEPAFSREATTFCVWRTFEDEAWQIGDLEFPEGPDPDGSATLMRFLDGRPATYKRWGDEYFGQPVHPGAIDRVYRHVPLSASLVAALNPEASFRELRTEIEEIGYPVV